MPKNKLSQETRQEIQRLYNEGLRPIEIARQTGVAYHTVYAQTRLTDKLRQRVNPETNKPFESKGEYEAYQARQRINPETNKPFESQTELQSYQARQRVNPETNKPFESQTELKDYQARQRINPETNKPFESLTELQSYQARQRKRRNANKKLEELITISLEVMEKSETWLAGKIGVSKAMVSLYAQGKSIPKPEVLRKLFRALRTPYKTLEDLVNDSE